MKLKYSFSAKMTGKFKKSPYTNKHKIAFPKQVLDVIRTSDIILEVLDARFIDKTRNIEMEKEVIKQEKKLIFVLNKIDLIDINTLKLNYDLSGLGDHILISCKSKVGRDRLRRKIKIEVKKLKLGSKKARIGIIGYPNTGKSTLINIVSGRKGTGTSAQSGYTKAIQKIRFNKDILILDTPGVYKEKENPEVNALDLKKHGQIGIKNYDHIKEPDFIVHDLMNQFPGKIERFYNIDSRGDPEILLEELGKRKNYKKKGNLIDIERAARMVLKDWQEGSIK